jgi:succinate dehydrogenase (ubiquinone) cytochrome b560 subunit
MKKISPHVSIYKFPITALSSITTRLTGLYLSGVFVGSGVCCVAGIDLYKSYQDLQNYQKKAIKYTLIFPMTYHTMGGLRHFVWDKYPHLLQNSKVAKSSYAIFAMSFGTTILIEKII